jgi:protease I
MTLPRLVGRKIGVVVEHKFIPEEIEAYRSGFALLGAEIELLSRLWYGSYQPDSNTFFSDVDPGDNRPWEGPHALTVQRDISKVKPEDYAAVIMSANYTSVRLRHTDMKSFTDLTEDEMANFDSHAHVKKAPVVQFFANAMENKRVVKGLLCHGLWILTPNPRLLRGRKVICHTVVMADIINCGGRIKLTRNGVVTDDDLVTGFSKHEVLPFIAAIAEQIDTRTS